MPITRFPAFNLRALRLVGPQHSYRVDFADVMDDEWDRPLAIIAGEISTGKTTVLEFVDWCLGAKEHPEHDEVMANVRSAQLAIDVTIPGEASRVRYVIERALGATTTRAYLYTGDLESMSGTPVRSFTSDPADTESLSHYLLQLCGLSGLRLDQSPSQAESKTSVLSFRDLQPLWFLTNRRLDNGDLAYERQPHRSIKLNQVVNILFGVSDNEQSILSRAVEELGSEERELARAIQTLRAFMTDAGLTTIEEIEPESDRLRVRVAELNVQKLVIDSDISARGDFTLELRASYARSETQARRIQAELRDRDTLARRLEPLRAQYADEIRRLDLVAESLNLFDSLSVLTCPACQSELQSSPKIVDNVCSLCNSHLTSDVSDGESAPDLSAERRNLVRRLNQLLKFFQEVRAEGDQLRRDLSAANDEVRAAQAALDRVSGDVISPYLAQRDEIQRALGDTRVELKTMLRARQMLLQLRQKEVELLQASAALKEARARKAEYLRSATPRDATIARIGERLFRILKDFGYPKIDLVHVDRNLVPFVRGRRYDKVGSSGAMTLIALAWELALFELAFEQGSGHPGFVIVDSPQKNLVPGSVAIPAAPDQVADEEDAEIGRLITTSRRNIVENIYRHVESWLAKHPGAQVIVVDNQPPSMADQHVVVRYSQSSDEPPYGLISNEDGRDPEAQDRPRQA
ncbi:DNA repair protein RecN [Salinibacterium sp. PAMC 21357]|uniref:DNA repair protein RecN n=1 Tax=Salinibacterium sp. PAMC 21357 TaxID=1112215 RepID=UPI000288A7B9|nr:DNA repair protein RecN [Salinibacterium sp. PAMC 21357]